MKNRPLRPSDNIRIVLLKPSHPGNIGAVARAMKNMGLRHLVLVDPKSFPDPEAVARAAQAAPLLEDAVVVNSLEEALTDCHAVFGTRSRSASLSWPVLSAREAADCIHQTLLPEGRQVAIVFGPERAGLQNDELQQCHYHVQIPADPDYPVLNLGQAVQIVAYELWMSAERSQEVSLVSSEVKERDLATHAELMHYFQHLERVLEQLGFIAPEMPKHTLAKLKRLFLRASLVTDEIKLLRGILRAMENKLKNPQDMLENFLENVD